MLYKGHTSSSQIIQKALLGMGWLLMTILALYLSAFTFIYFNFHDDVFFLLTKKDVVHYIPWRTAFYIHITGGMISLAVGPFQFLKRFREKHLKFHRILGKIYVASILLIGGPAGFFMAFFASGGPYAHIGFMILALLWMGTTWLALRAILRKDVATHTRWMIRSYSLCFAAVTLRLLVPILSLGFHVSASRVLLIVAWASWIINLIIAQLIIYIKDRKKHVIISAT